MPTKKITVKSTAKKVGNHIQVRTSVSNGSSTRTTTKNISIR